MARRRRTALLSYIQLCRLATILFQIQHLAGSREVIGALEVSGRNQYASQMRLRLPLPLQLKSGAQSEATNFASDLVPPTATSTRAMALRTREPTTVTEAKMAFALLDLAQLATTTTTTAISKPSTNDAGQHPMGDVATERSPLLVAAANSDEDVVISASEILTDSSPVQRRLATLKSGKRRPEPPANGLDQAQNASCNPTSATEDTRWPEDQLALGEHQSASAQDRRQPNSRLLLQILVFGLFGLVLLSLMLVYAIKFCVCRRRKRRLLHLQRNLVADVDQSRTHHFECTCQQPAPFTLHRPIGWSSAPFGAQLHLHQLGTLGESHQPPTCLLPDHIPRPPTYAELFGSQQAPVSHESEQLSALGRQSPADGAGSSSCSTAETSGASSQPQPPKNLLVKLNLNKTKLLSAEDLVLLSKLIDVPIVVQQQHQQQQQQQQHQAPSSEQVSCGLEPARPLSLHEESEEEAEEEEEES